MWFKKADKFALFPSLPLHIQRHVLHFLSSVRDVLNFGSSCKQYLLMTNHDVVWQALYKLRTIPNNGIMAYAQNITKQGFTEDYKAQRMSYNLFWSVSIFIMKRI